MKFSEAVIEPFKEMRRKLNKDNAVLFLGVLGVLVFISVPLTVPVVLYYYSGVMEWYGYLLIGCHCILWSMYSFKVLSSWGKET